MLIYASGEVYPGFHLYTFGGSCHYAIRKQNGCALFDPGLSVHVPYLYQRLAQEAALKPDQIEQVFLTHLHPERIANIPLLRRNSPTLQVCGSAQMQDTLADPEFARAVYEQDREFSALYSKAEASAEMSFEEYAPLLRVDRVFPDSEVFEISEDLRVRGLRAPGHAQESMVYLIEPYDFLIVDEGFGYFRGRDPAAPGGDWDLQETLATLHKFKDLELSAICLPNAGLITGQLVRNHLQAVEQNTHELLAESRRALRARVPEEEMQSSLRRWYYASNSKDPLVHKVMERTFLAVWRQVQALQEELPGPTS